VAKSSHSRARGGLRARAATLLLAGAICTAALALTACAGSGGGSAAGRALFSEECGSCHTLSGPRRVTQGGDLRAQEIPREAMLQFVREMPVRHALDAREVDAVADYVRAVQRGDRASRGRVGTSSPTVARTP
jgi:mono/diheme cytochrome c family protein